MYHLELRQFPHNFCHFNLTLQTLHETVLDAWVRGEWVEVGERHWNSLQATLTVIEGPQLSVGQLSMGRGWRNASRQGTDVTAQLLADARSRLGLADTPAHAPGPPQAAQPGGVRSVWSALTGPSSPRASGPQPASGPSPGSAAPGRGPTPASGPGARPSSEAPVGEYPATTATGAPGQPTAHEALSRQLLSLLGPNPGPLLRAWQLASEQHPDRTPSQCLASAEDFVGR